MESTQNNRHNEGPDQRKPIIRVNEKPEVCPVCRSTRIAAYLFGEPRVSPDLDKKLKQGKIVLGGCCISDDDPDYKCMECLTDFHRTKDLR
jgi:hypothetical protein